MEVTLSGLHTESGLAPVVSKGFLDAATGEATLDLESLWVSGAQVTGGTGAFSVELAEATRPGAVARLQGIHAEMAFLVRSENSTPVLQGTGSIAGDLLEAGGVKLRAINGALRGEGRRLHVENLTSDLLGGRLVARAEIGVLEAGLPVHIFADLHDVDLGLFTEEFEPPSVVLTGKVSGNGAIQLSPSGFEDFEAQLTAEKGITLNRGMVEQILLSQQVAGVTGGKTLGKVVQKVIGEGEQRPFDRATMDLGFEGGRITGQARLESEQLNLTIDIKADPEALLEALRIQQGQ